MFDVIGGALLVFAMRVCDVSLGTVRQIFAVRGHGVIAAGIGFVEVTFHPKSARFLPQSGNCIYCTGSRRRWSVICRAIFAEAVSHHGQAERRGGQQPCAAWFQGDPDRRSGQGRNICFKQRQQGFQVPFKCLGACPQYVYQSRKSGTPTAASDLVRKESSGWSIFSTARYLSNVCHFGSIIRKVWHPSWEPGFSVLCEIWRGGR